MKTRRLSYGASIQLSDIRPVLPSYASWQSIFGKALQTTQRSPYKTVYNWQYVHSLDFWSCVLSEHCSPIKEAGSGRESQLRPLIYPAVQVTLGAMRLIPTATYFPLRSNSSGLFFDSPVPPAHTFPLHQLFSRSQLSRNEEAPEAEHDKKPRLQHSLQSAEIVPTDP